MMQMPVIPYFMFLNPVPSSQELNRTSNEIKNITQI